MYVSGAARFKSQLKISGVEKGGGAGGGGGGGVGGKRDGV